MKLYLSNDMEGSDAFRIFLLHTGGIQTSSPRLTARWPVSTGKFRPRSPARGSCLALHLQKEEAKLAKSVVDTPLDANFKMNGKISLSVND